MNIPFFQTRRGAELVDGTLPRLVRALERGAAALEELAKSQQEAVPYLGVPRVDRKDYRDRARDLYEVPGEVEIDDEAKIVPPEESCSKVLYPEGSGAWVEAWVWVPADERVPEGASGSFSARSQIGMSMIKRIEQLRVLLEDCRRQDVYGVTICHGCGHEIIDGVCTERCPVQRALKAL